MNDTFQIPNEGNETFKELEEQVRGREMHFCFHEKMKKKMLYANAADDDADSDYYPKITHPNLTHLYVHVRPFICECVIIYVYNKFVL